jgi:hypothetical protein
MDRRGFLKVLAAPAIILTPGLLMPVRKLWTPPLTLQEAIDTMPDAYVIGYDPARKPDYGAWIQMQYDETTQILRIVDWYPR